MANVERNFLSKLLANPSKVFDVDGRLMDEADLSSEVARCTYVAIRALAVGGAKIDRVVLGEKVASIFPKYYAKRKDEVEAFVSKVAKADAIGKLSEYVRIILSRAIRRRSMAHLRQMARMVRETRDHQEVLSTLQGKTVEFTTKQMRVSEVVRLGATLEDWIAMKEEMVREGRKVGLSSGYQFYDEAIGGGFRPGSVDMVVARAKTGKSVLGLNIAINVANVDVPVLYLDTEMTKEQEMPRLISVMTSIPLHYLDTGKFLRKEGLRKLIKDGKERIEGLPLDYVEVAGWKLQKQLSMIRSWHARNVGRDESGASKPCLVIMDYLKIMDPSEKGYDTREWEALGYHLSAIGNLAKELRIPIFTMGQQNRLGLEEDHEGTVAGTDRFSWYCTSLSILAAKRAEDLEAEYEDPDRDPKQEPSNFKLKVANSRFGAGNPGHEYITFYSDIKNPRMKKRRMNCRMEERAQQTIKPTRRRGRQ